MKRYVGNLPYNASGETLRNLFSWHRQVQGIWIGNTRVSSPHSCRFVHMLDDTNAETAIERLDGIRVEACELTVHRGRD